VFHKKGYNITTKYIMPSKKRNCSTFNKTYKNWLSKKKRGGCGCQNGQQSQTPFSGGRRRRRTRRMKGGDALGLASLTDFDPGFKYTYPLNDHMNDPLAPSNIVDVRMQPNMTGGRRRKSRSRRIRGGSSDPYIKAYESNTLSSSPFTSLSGASNAANIITGQDNIRMTYSDNLRTGIPFI
jgi:hypothetical protein